MKSKSLFLLLFIITTIACKNSKKSENEGIPEVAKTVKNDTLPTEVSEVDIIPISHATTVLEYKDMTIYVDPTGGLDAFKDQKKADMVFITDIHGDHMDVETLDSLDLTEAKVIVPRAVAEKLPAKYTEQLILINNGETKTIEGIAVEAIPMYNLREEALKFHPKGRGNGYVLTFGDQRVYFSGDTEDIPEMRNLENIDIAFVCMNLPYTMPVESAADAVLAFKPDEVYPYHYRGTDGLSNVGKFKEIVNAGNPEIEVVQLDWYPSMQ